jgi:hypothetical protein
VIVRDHPVVLPKIDFFELERLLASSNLPNLDSLSPFFSSSMDLDKAAEYFSRGMYVPMVLAMAVDDMICVCDAVR